MTVLTEQPRFIHPIALYARKDGQYTRPIIGQMIDLRFEDMGLRPYMASAKLLNMIARLPDIRGTNQRHAYIVIEFDSFERVETNPTVIDTLIKSGKYFILPSDRQSPYWTKTNAPWWEFAEVCDEYNGIIKAAYKTRPGEPTPEEADERLDEFEENHNRLEVLAPTTLEKMLVGSIKESCYRKLERIKIFTSLKGGDH